MASKASIKGHPIHPVLVAFPIGLWVFSLVSDIIFLAGGSATWGDVAFYTMGGGIVGALLAAIPGFVDLFSWSKSAVRTVGQWHMALNLTAVVIFAVNFMLRLSGIYGYTLPFVLSMAGVLTIAISGWLGGEMVYRYRVVFEPHGMPGAPPSEAAPKREQEMAGAGRR